MFFLSRPKLAPTPRPALSVHCCTAGWCCRLRWLQHCSAAERQQVIICRAAFQPRPTLTGLHQSPCCTNVAATKIIELNIFPLYWFPVFHEAETDFKSFGNSEDYQVCVSVSKVLSVVKSFYLGCFFWEWDSRAEKHGYLQTKCWHNGMFELLYILIAWKCCNLSPLNMQFKMWTSCAW